MSGSGAHTMVDATARERIVADLDTTFVVEAAAGTGKTTQLVRRIVAVLRGGRGRLEQIVALTFTDKAAGELKLRLRSEIDRVRGELALGSAERARLDAALAELEVARIGTIHSFCADLLRERPIEAGVDPAFEVMNDDERERVLGIAFDRWFERALADPPEGLRRFLRRRTWMRAAGPRTDLRRACRDLIEHRDHLGTWPRAAFDRPARIDALVEALAALASLHGRARRPSDYLAQCVADVAMFVDEIRRREASRPRDYDELEASLRGLARQGDNWRRKGSGSWFAEGLARSDVLAQRDACKRTLDAFLQDAEADLAACLRVELAPVVDSYESLKQEAGVLDFLDLLIRARDLVQRDRTMREGLQRRISHVFVDEFQDTDPLQAEILLLLAADDPAEARMDRARPVAGKLFVVGDPKQSVYRFRRADVALYERVKARLIERGAELLHLTTSFRSVPPIQSVVNACFAPLMQAAEDASQADYVALEPHRDGVNARPSVVALPVPRPYGRSALASSKVRESTPAAVAAWVDWLLRESRWSVHEAAAAAEAPVASRHVCLLFRSVQSYGADLTRPYVRALEARGIPHVLVGGRSVYEREEVTALRAAITAIEWPDDALAVYATLRGPFLALSDDALLDFSTAVGKLHPLRPRDGEANASLSGTRAEVAGALALLGDLHAARNSRPIADTIARFLDETRAHAGLAIWPSGEQALANVLRIMDLARRFESRGATSFRAFVEWLDEQAARGEGGEAPIVEEGAEGVRLMTVHAAKGLEFPVVVLCDPTTPRDSGPPSRYVDAANDAWIFPLAGCRPAELRAHADAIRRADDAEEIRIGYVAATRARDVLVVPCVGDGRVAGWVDVLHPVLYPPASAQRSARAAPGCPAFGDDSVLERPVEAMRWSGESVQPGLHTIAGVDVVWWDPHALDLDRRPAGGLRQHELLKPDAGELAASEGERAHRAWVARRDETLHAGAKPSVVVHTVADAAARALAKPDATTVALERTTAPREGRPSGRRFGTLVHAILAEIPYGADEGAVRAMAATQARLVAAPDDEREAAVVVARAALDHALMRSAAVAEKAGRCRRETPVTLRVGEALVEGVVDLAFCLEPPGQSARWIVIDFKTDRGEQIPWSYRAQVALYAQAISAATGEPARAVILSV